MSDNTSYSNLNYLVICGWFFTSCVTVVLLQL